jgi:hypothetical protein
VLYAMLYNCSAMVTAIVAVVAVVPTQKRAAALSDKRATLANLCKVAQHHCIVLNVVQLQCK